MMWVLDGTYETLRDDRTALAVVSINSLTAAVKPGGSRSTFSIHYADTGLSMPEIKADLEKIVGET
jgi:hypothetical protein